MCNNPECECSNCTCDPCECTAGVQCGCSEFDNVDDQVAPV